MLHQSLLDRHDTDMAPALRSLSIEVSVFNDLLIDARAALAHDTRTVRRCLDKMAALLDQPAPIDDERILPTIALTDIDRSPIKGGLAPWQLRRVLAYIHEHLAGPIFVEALATLARLSGGHFCRAFKASVGETPHNFLVRERIRRAQSLMLTTNDTLSEIACACGLTDQAHLTRLFRKFVGDTPLTWRRMWQNA
jgi:AraC-like DNA-binding protein